MRKNQNRMKVNIFKRNGKLYQAAAEKLKYMPELRHSVQGQEFNIENSELMAWLIKMPEIRQIIVDMAKNSEYLVYNPNTGIWQGVYSAEENHGEPAIYDEKEALIRSVA